MSSTWDDEIEINFIEFLEDYPDIHKLLVKTDDNDTQYIDISNLYHFCNDSGLFDTMKGLAYDSQSYTDCMRFVIMNPILFELAIL